MDWHSRVYRKIESDGKKFRSDEWRMLRQLVLKNDKFYCQRCDKKFPNSELTAHHIVPRDDGGVDDLSNLITLCNPCHDYVEINNLRSRAAIMGSIEIETPMGDAVVVGDWHAWVYGGARNPQLDRR